MVDFMVENEITMFKIDIQDDDLSTMTISEYIPIKSIKEEE